MGGEGMREELDGLAFQAERIAELLDALAYKLRQLAAEREEVTA